jgi:hypothetical protein
MLTSMRASSSAFSSIFVVAVVATFAAGGAAAQEYTAEDPPTCVDLATISFCSGDTLQTASCPEFIEGSICAERGCFGSVGRICRSFLLMGFGFGGVGFCNLTRSHFGTY